MFNPTLDPFDAAGLGEPGVCCKLILEPACPRGLGEPYECLLEPLVPTPPIAFCKYWLVLGENGEPEELRPLRGLPDCGELGLLLGDPLIGVGVRVKRGGVTYDSPEANGLLEGGSPKSFR